MSGPAPEFGNVPPVDPPEAPPRAERSWDEPPERPEQTSHSPDRPLEPAEAYRRYMRQQELNRVEVDQMVDQAKRSGVQKGIFTGLFTGAMYEHIAHKRREKRTERRAKKERERLDRARRDYRFGLQEQERRQAESDQRFAAAEQRFAGAEKRMEQREKHLEERIRSAEQAAAQAEQEQLKVAAEHQVQMSAWHAIETDRRTGKAVEKPSFQYGHEYYRERAQESIPADQRNAAAGGVAILGTAARTDGAQDGASGASGMAAGQHVNIPDATTRRSTQGSSQSPYGDSDDRSAAPLWPWVLALLVVVIGLIVAFS